MTYWNSVPNLNAIEQSATELLRFQYLTLWPWTCVTCCARLWNNFHQVWHSTTYPYLNYNVFMLIRYIKLWPWSLTRWYWKFVVHSASRDQSLYKIWTKSSRAILAEWLIILRIFPHVMSCCDIELWPFDLERLKRFGCHEYKIRAKSNNPRLSCWEFSTFSPCNFKEHFYQTVLRGRRPNFAKLGKNIAA